MKLDALCQNLFDIWNEYEIEDDEDGLKFHNLIFDLNEIRSKQRKLKRERTVIDKEINGILVDSGHNPILSEE